MLLAPPTDAPQPDNLLRLVVVLAGLITAAAPIVVAIINRRHGRTKDSERRTEYTRMLELMEQRHDRTDQRVVALRSSTETQITELREVVTREIGETRQMFMERVDALGERLAEVDRTATEAKHASVGIDGQNGTRGDLRKLEDRVDDIEGRERDRLHGPYTPKRASGQ